MLFNWYDLILRANLHVVKSRIKHFQKRVTPILVTWKWIIKLLRHSTALTRVNYLAFFYLIDWLLRKIDINTSYMCWYFYYKYCLSNTNVDCVFHTNHCNKKLFSMNHIKMQFLYERIICIFFVWVSQHDTNQEKDVSTFVPIFTRNVVIMNQSLQFSRKDKKYFIKTHWVVSKINVPIAQGQKSFLMD